MGTGIQSYPRTTRPPTRFQPAMPNSAKITGKNGSRLMSHLTVFLVEDNALIQAQLIPALNDLVSARVLAAVETENEAVECSRYIKAAGIWPSSTCF